MNQRPDNDWLERALGYPYPVPAQIDFLFADGEAQDLPNAFDFSGRRPVLAVGSNRSPLQLRRKYGTQVQIPVTRLTTTGYDVAYCAYLASYGSVPVTLVNSPGMSIDLAVTWLTESQLTTMHGTEAVGSYTWFGSLPVAPTVSGGQVVESVFTYISARGALLISGAVVSLAGLTRTPAPNQVRVQSAVLEDVWRRYGAGDFTEWLLSVVTTPEYREELNQLMQNKACKAMPAGFDRISDIR